jgi:hypothetical protein
MRSKKRKKKVNRGILQGNNQEKSGNTRIKRGIKFTPGNNLVHRKQARNGEDSKFDPRSVKLTQRSGLMAVSGFNKEKSKDSKQDMESKMIKAGKVTMRRGAEATRDTEPGKIRDIDRELQERNQEALEHPNLNYAAIKQAEANLEVFTMEGTSTERKGLPEKLRLQERILEYGKDTTAAGQRLGQSPISSMRWSIMKIKEEKGVLTLHDVNNAGEKGRARGNGITHTWQCIIINSKYRSCAAGSNLGTVSRLQAFEIRHLRDHHV